MNTYRDLSVWQKAMELTVAVYEISKRFPKEELYGITSQIRRSVISIPSNIAEGKMRGSEAEFKRFLLIAYASGAELETQIELSKRVFGNSHDQYGKIEALLNEVMRMLNKLISGLTPNA